MRGKIIQIIPAPENLYVTYNDGEDFDVKVVCLALTDQGDILLMDIDDNGFITEAQGYTAIKWS